MIGLDYLGTRPLMNAFAREKQIRLQWKQMRFILMLPLAGTVQCMFHMGQQCNRAMGQQCNGATGQWGNDATGQQGISATGHGAQCVTGQQGNSASWVYITGLLVLLCNHSVSGMYVPSTEWLHNINRTNLKIRYSI